MIRFLIVMVLALFAAAAAQEQATDSVDVSAADSVDVVDSVSADTADSVGAGDSLAVPGEEGDTLTAAERARQRFEQRLQDHQAEVKEKERIYYPSFFDSLVTYFTSPRMNLRDDVDRGFYHDAGDYFRYKAGYFAASHQATPMRSTVQPFGLKGDRTNFVHSGYSIQPLGHIPEPDGLIGLNAIPTALDNEIYVLPGAMGMLYGGSSAVASLVTRPLRPNDHNYHSALLADQGGFGYAFVRGRMSKLFTDGRRVNASVAYRNADGDASSRYSDQYDYYGDFFFPIWERSGIHAWGHLYDMEGPLAVRPDIFGTAVNRSRFDRQARLSFTNDNESRSRRFEIGYTHRRQGSDLTGVLQARLNYTGHGAFMRTAWVGGTWIHEMEVDANYLEFDFGPGDVIAYSSDFAWRMLDISEGWRVGASLGGSYVEEYGFLPSGSMTFLREGNGGLFALSLGYAERAPSEYERYLPRETGLLYGGSNGYAEEGNHLLEKEQQITGSVVTQVGSAATNLGLTVAGGYLIDGIDWWPERISSSLLEFKPENGDVVFASGAVEPRLQISDFLTFRGGASYYYLDYDVQDDPAYSPEYDAFSGLELHVYWPQRAIHLYAYGELVYTGPYRGYDQEGLGEEVVANAKLSFKIKNYRMHFVFQNGLGNTYRVRENFTYPGRYFYLGFEWGFLN